MCVSNEEAQSVLRAIVDYLSTPGNEPKSLLFIFHPLHRIRLFLSALLGPAPRPAAQSLEVTTVHRLDYERQLWSSWRITWLVYREPQG